MTARSAGSVAAAGFTLLELLVALVVLGFILVGLSQGVRYGLRATDTQARLIEGRGDLDAVDRTLRQLIERAVPATAHSGPTLQGGSGRLVLLSELPAGLGERTARAGGGQLADLAIGVDGRHRLVLRWTPHLHAEQFGPKPTPAEVELLAGVERIELAFWGDAWVDAWSATVLPGLVRIRLVFATEAGAAGDHRHWPDIVVAPMRQRPE